MIAVQTASSLSERFESFVKTLDGFESIDALLRGADQRGKKRADYLVRNRHVVIEQKVLHSNPIGRPQKFIDKLARERGIRIYGCRPSLNKCSIPVVRKHPMRFLLSSDLSFSLDDDLWSIGHMAVFRVRNQRINASGNFGQCVISREIIL
jgi:hypothetical protein